MTPYIHYYTVDIRSGMRMEREKSPVGQFDALADRFEVTLLDGREKIDLTGIGVSASVIRPDGVTVPIVGTVEDGAACVTLGGECYDVSGDIIITISISAGDIRQSVLRVMMNVVTSETGIVTETETLNLAEVLAAVGRIEDAAARAEAAADRAEAAGGGGGGGSGEDGFSPVANVQQTDSGAVITITDKTGTTTARITNGVDGQDGSSGVHVGAGLPEDPEVNVWIDPDGGEYLPVASPDTLGGVKVGDGLQMTGDVLSVVPEGVYELIETITLTEAATIERTQEPDGTPYSFDALWVHIRVPAGAQVTAGSVLFYKVGAYGADQWFAHRWMSQVDRSEIGILTLWIAKLYGHYIYSMPVEWDKDGGSPLLRGESRLSPDQLVADKPIGKVSITMTLPAGSIITIRGVRANA